MAQPPQKDTSKAQLDGWQANAFPRQAANQELPPIDSEGFTAEIVARLMMAHRSSAKVLPLKALSSAIGDDERDDFLAALVEDDSVRAHAILEALEAEGVSRRVILIDLVCTTAQRLGGLWDADEASFADVTLSMCVLHRLVRERSWADASARGQQVKGRRILVTTLPDEQHILGVSVVSEVFAEAGWDVHQLPGGSSEAVAQALAETSFDTLGLSVAVQPNEVAAAEHILAWREASKCHHLNVIIGGHALLQAPELFRRIGADAGIFDAASAPYLAEGLRTDLSPYI